MSDNKEPKTGKEFMEDEEEAIENREKIQKVFSHITFPKPILEPLYFGRLTKTMAENKKLIIDKSTGSQFAIVSNKYRVVYHEDVLKDFIEAIPDEFGEPDFKIYLINNGARMSVTAKFPEIIDTVKDSPVNMMVRLQNSYDTSVLVGYQWGAIEQICTNGMVAFKEYDKSKARHITGSITKLQLSDKIKDTFVQFSEQIDLWESWVHKQLSKPNLVKIFEALPFSENEIEKVKALPLLNHNKKTLLSMNKPSIWAVNSAVTQYATHEISSDKRSLDLEDKIGRIMTNFAHTV